MKMTSNRLSRLHLGILAAGLFALPALVSAQHYVPGVEGLKAASLPPPGIYLRDYNVAYYADQVNDASGHKAPFDITAFVYANIPRLVWITDKQLLGGYIGVDALIPIEYTHLDIPAANLDHGTLGLGDAFAEVTWSKHTQRFDFSLAAGVWFPTGDSSPTGLSTRAGKGYWGEMLTAGATWYIDGGKKWALSALNRYEFNQKKDGTDITPGQAYTVEGGLSYALTPKMDVGAVGYYQQKVTTDSGKGSSDTRDRVAAIGPEIGGAVSFLRANVTLRYLYEFMAESRLQGHTIALTLTKPL